jgi:hypothetical protein
MTLIENPHDCLSVLFGVIGVKRFAELENNLA